MKQDLKKKLTLSLSEKGIMSGKRKAKKLNTSVSKLVEEFLLQDENPQECFVEKWSGQFVAEPQDTDRYKAIAKKHL